MRQTLKQLTKLSAAALKMSGANSPSQVNHALLLVVSNKQ